MSRSSVIKTVLSALFIEPEKVNDAIGSAIVALRWLFDDDNIDIVVDSCFPSKTAGSYFSKVCNLLLMYIGTSIFGIELIDIDVFRIYPENTVEVSNVVGMLYHRHSDYWFAATGNTYRYGRYTTCGCGHVFDLSPVVEKYIISSECYPD